MFSTVVLQAPVLCLNQIRSIAGQMLNILTLHCDLIFNATSLDLARGSSPICSPAFCHFTIKSDFMKLLLHLIRRGGNFLPRASVPYYLRLYPLAGGRKVICLSSSSCYQFLGTQPTVIGQLGGRSRVPRFHVLNSPGISQSWLLP